MSFAPTSYVATCRHKLKAYYKGWFEVDAKISVMALTPSPLSVIMTCFLKNSLEVSPKLQHTKLPPTGHSQDVVCGYDTQCDVYI